MEDFNLNYTYKLVSDSPTMGPANVVIRKEDNADIPFNDENYDYSTQTLMDFILPLTNSNKQSALFAKNLL